ncbi:MAG: hypothetical protein JWR26_3161 [Pedosphaera sp.]|nr:hypothetical protein [Pedosphaera sp.]
MSNSFLLIRTLIIYGICLPLAVIVGYMLATPDDSASLLLVVIVFSLLTIPLFLRWHHQWLIAAWNMSAVVFFLPGSPSIGLTICFVSLLLSLLQHTLNKNVKFVYVPTLAWPLAFLAVVVLATAKLTGGIGLQIAGSSSYGGKRYILVLGAILGYFAITAHRIPPHRVAWAVRLFFASSMIGIVANLLFAIFPTAFFLFKIFPVDAIAMMAVDRDAADAGGGSLRLGGLAMSGATLFSILLAIYGIKGIFSVRHLWRFLLFALCLVVSLFGGFRSILIGLMITFALVFWLEGLMRNRMVPVLVLMFVMGAAVLAPFTDKLPLSVQRTLCFIPMLPVDPIAANEAQGSTEWRLEMWKAVLPEVPKYLILGKGYSFDPNYMRMLQQGLNKGAETAEGSILAGDYHNGPLSVIMPFGIFGAIAFLWFMVAGTKVLHYHYKFGDPAYKCINTFLLAQFVGKCIMFFTVIGSLYSDMAIFTGLVALSVCINGPIRASSPAPMPTMVFNRFKLAHANAQTSPPQ